MLNLKESALQMLDYLFQVETYLRARQPAVRSGSRDQHRAVYSLETETGKTKNCRDHGERNVEGVS